MIIKLAIKVRVQQFEGGRRINFGFSFNHCYTAHYAAKASWGRTYMLSQYSA